MGAQRSDLERLDRQLEIVDRGGGRREVQERIERSGQEDVLRDVVLDELEPGIPGKVLDVPDVARDQIVEPDHLVTFRQEPIAKMGPQKTAGPGHEYPHSNLPRASKAGEPASASAA